MELFKIITLLDDVVANLLFYSLLFNVTNLLANVLLLMNTMSKCYTLYSLNVVEVYNICSSIVALNALTSYGSQLTTAVENLVQYATDMNVDLIDQANFRSVSDKLNN